MNFIANKSNTRNLAESTGDSALRIIKDDIRQVMAGDGEHVMEHVATIFGIHFVNNSKSTNVNATWYSIDVITSPVVLLLGGVDKGNDYSMLKEFHQKIRSIITIGIDVKKIVSFAKLFRIHCQPSSNMKDAVTKAHANAKNGDTILLSPACASFDQYENYEARGREFKNCVKEI